MGKEETVFNDAGRERGGTQQLHEGVIEKRAAAGEVEHGGKVAVGLHVVPDVDVLVVGDGGPKIEGHRIVCSATHEEKKKQQEEEVAFKEVRVWRT